MQVGILHKCSHIFGRRNPFSKGYNIRKKIINVQEISSTREEHIIQFTTIDFSILRQPIKHRHTTANINSSLESDTKHSPFHVACSNSSPVTISFFSKSTCKWILLAGSRSEERRVGKECRCRWAGRHDEIRER